MNLIIFEGIHRVGKSTLLSELHDPNNGVLNLYQDTNVWDKTFNLDITNYELYYMQFVSSLKSSIHFLKLIAETKKYHTIYIDRWYLTSLYYNQKIKGVNEYINSIEMLLNEMFTLHTVIFTTNTYDMSQLEYPSNEREDEFFKLCVDKFPTKKTIIELENTNGYFDIKEKFNIFVQNNLIQ